MGDRQAFERAVAAIDSANGEDPVQVSAGGDLVPKELLHSKRMVQWVSTLEPAADEAQLLAARAHHLRRWALPRSDYPDGRAGYLRWRRDQGRRQASEISTILGEAGVDQAVTERVAALVAKRVDASDPAMQVHEDALCLVFLELQLDEFIDEHGEAKTVDVVRRTAAKMSPRVLDLVAEVGLSERGGRVVASAVAGESAG